tara:strand:- start:1251 stop:1652 length:402 start_codon:yes stop_codon:yes gene_type:complete
MVSKSTYLSTFNKQFIDFLEDILISFPNNKDILNMQNTILTVKKINPSLLIKLWYSFVYQPYYQKIENDDISFFLDKNYSEDIKLLDDQKTTLEAIERLRNPIKELDKDNQDKCMKYLKNLSLLSKMYTESNK